MRVGLTGGIASGKTTVAQRFAELGVPVIDADEVARALVAPGQPALTAVVERFGPGVLDRDGSLERRALRSRVFADAAARRDLEAILHPAIRAQMERLSAAAAGPYVVLAIPLLIEGGAARSRVDRILVVDTDEAVQLARVQARDGSSVEEARAIVAAQASRTARLACADDVLENSGDLATLRAAVDDLHRRYLALAAV
jgi:dephospho-CoA kinase